MATSTTTDGAGLLRAILERPECDVVRGAYADWLDEHDQPEHAEFVRVQCRIWEAGRHHCYETCRPPFEGCPNKALRERELELWHRLPTYQVFAPWAGGVSPDHTLPQFHIGDQSGPLCIISRGFVSEVRLTLGAFLGERCRRCGGNGWLYWNVVGVESGRDPCVHCSGTGRTEGVARRLFAAQPVERITLVDREPHWNGGGFCWYRRGRSRPGAATPESAVLPDDFFDQYEPLDAEPVTPRLYSFANTEDANVWLSQRCVALGRELAGLTRGGER